MQLGKNHLKNVEGLTFFKILGSGAKNGFSAIPNFGTYVLFCVWETERHAAAFFERDPFFNAYQDRSSEQFTAYLHSAEAHGSWDGIQPFEKFCEPTLQLINAYRKENGLTPLVFDESMILFSQSYISEILENDVFEHSDLNGGEYSVENLFKSMGFGGFLVIDQEWCDELPSLIFNAWKKSKGHNVNMLNPGITKVGMSIQIQTKGEVGTYGYNLDCILVGK